MFPTAIGSVGDSVPLYVTVPVPPRVAEVIWLRVVRMEIPEPTLFNCRSTKRTVEEYQPLATRVAEIVGDSVPLPLNVAVTACPWLIVTEQLPVPEQAPLHPAKVDPVLATAVSVTGVPLL
jgi:hypothetical protein